VVGKGDLDLGPPAVVARHVELEHRLVVRNRRGRELAVGRLSRWSRLLDVRLVRCVDEELGAWRKPERGELESERVGPGETIESRHTTVAVLQPVPGPLLGQGETDRISAA